MIRNAVILPLCWQGNGQLAGKAKAEEGLTKKKKKRKKKAKEGTWNPASTERGWDGGAARLSRTSPAHFSPSIPPKLQAEADALPHHEASNGFFFSFSDLS